MKSTITLLILTWWSFRQRATQASLQRFWRYCMHYWGEVQEVQVKGCLPECLLLLRFDAWKLILDVERAGAIKFDTSLPTGSVIRLPNNQTDCVSSLKALLQLGPYSDCQRDCVCTLRVRLSEKTGSVFRLPTRLRLYASRQAVGEDWVRIPTANEIASLRFASGCRKGM